MECLEALLVNYGHYKKTFWVLTTSLEEFLEISGAALFLYSLLNYIENEFF